MKIPASPARLLSGRQAGVKPCPTPDGTCPAPDGSVDNIISEIRGQKIEGSKILVMGITFKENCPDIRNSRVIDVIGEFWSYNCEVEVYDPWADFEEVKAEYGIDLIKDKEDLVKYDAIVEAVAHREFEELALNQYSKDGATVVYDIKGALPKDKMDARL